MRSFSFWRRTLESQRGPLVSGCLIFICYNVRPLSQSEGFFHVVSPPSRVSVDTYRLTSIFQPQLDQQLFSFVSFEAVPPNTGIIVVEITVVCCHREGIKEG